MKRYLLFAGSDYYPCGGMEDFLYDYDTEKEALENRDRIFRERMDKHGCIWCHVYDQELRKFISPNYTAFHEGRQFEDYPEIQKEENVKYP